MSLVNVILQTDDEAPDEADVVPSEDIDGGESPSNEVWSEEETSIAVPDTGIFSGEGSTYSNPILISGTIIMAIVAFFLIVKRFKSGHRVFAKGRGFSIDNKKQKVIASLSALACVFAVSGALSSNISKIDTTSAATDDSIAISTGDVELSVIRRQGASAYGFAKSSVSVVDGTNNGYVLGAYASGTDIISAEDETNKITNTVFSNAALELNTWGISLNTPVDQDSEVWSPVPVSEADALILKTTDSRTEAGDATDVYLGAYVGPDLPDGIYSGVTINYFAIANVVTPDTFTLSFNANNGTGAPAAQSCTPEEAGAACSVVIPTSTPTRSGHTFLGWADTSSATTATYQPGGSLSLRANKRIYAVWSQNTTVFSLSFDMNGGAGGPDTQTCTARGTATSCLITISSIRPTRSDYDFLGWADSATAATAKYDAGERITMNSSKTVYAIWKKASTTSTFTLSFDANGGTGAPAAQSCTTTSTSCAIVISTLKPTRTNYTFIGWATTPGASTAQYNDSARNVAMTKNTTIYAVWKNNYTIKFNGNGSTGGSMSNLSMVYGTAKKLTANAFTRTGYKFTSWNTKADGTGVAYTDKQSVNNLTTTAGKTVNLYAQWESPKGKVHFLNTGSSNAFLIESGGKYGLIDSSNPLYPKNASNPSYCMSDVTCVSKTSNTVQHVVDYLRKIGVKKLDFVVASHSHSDHIGGMPVIAQNFVDSNTKYYYRRYTGTAEDTINPDWYNRDYYNRAVNAMQTAGAQLIEVTSSEPTFSLGEFSLKILNSEPASSSELNSSGVCTGENLNSLVVLATFGSKKVLFAGDMEKPDEAKVANKVGKIDILQMGHHGSDTSSSVSYIGIIKPKDVVIPSALETGKFRQWAGMAYAFKNYQTNFYQTSFTNEAIIINFENNNYTINDYGSTTTATKIGITSESSDKGQWIKFNIKNNTFWAHIKSNGTVSTGWEQLRYGDVAWYYFDENNGGMAFDEWRQITYQGKKQWFYFLHSGRMATGTQWIHSSTYGNEQFEFNSAGVCVSGRGCPLNPL